jgi:hypothetical protein
MLVVFHFNQFLEANVEVMPLNCARSSEVLPIRYL